MKHDLNLLQFISSNLKLENLPKNSTFQIEDEDDFLILISGEIVGINRQIKFSPGSIFGGTSLARMIIKEKDFKCHEDCVFGVVELQKLKEYQLQLSQLALINKTVYLLSQSRYFSQWNSNQIQQIIQDSTRVFFKQNQWVYSEGQQSTSVYIIVSGKFSIYKRIFIRNQSQPELSSNQSQRQQLNPLKKCIDLIQGDVVGDEDDINQERFYGVCCKSENGQMLRIDIYNFVKISELQQLTQQQVLKRKKITQKRYQYFEKSQQNEILKYQGTQIQISCSKQQSGQATPQEISTFICLNNSQTENTNTIIPSNRSNQKLKNAIQILQSRSNSKENLLISTIQKSNQNSNEEDPNLNATHEDLSYENTNKLLSKQSSIESNSPIKRIQKSSSQSNISSEQLKCIPISFRLDYIQARKRFTRKLDDVKKNAKMALPDESIKIAKSNLRAEQKEQSFEKFSEQAYKNISKEIKKNYSIKFWHQMQNQIIKLATYSKKMNNDQSNQYIRQDPSSESRPLIRNIQKKIQNMNNKTIYNLENSGYIKRFNSTQDLSSPQIRSTNNYNSQLSYQNFIQQKSFAQINNEQSSFLEQGKPDKNLQTKSTDSSPLKKAPYSFHIQQAKQKNNQPHRYLIPAQSEPQCFSEAIKAQKNQNLQKPNTKEQKEGSLSPIISPIQRPIHLQASRSSLGDINQVKDRSPAYMSPIFNALNSQSNIFKDHAFHRKSLINLHQMPKNQDEQREKDISKKILQQKQQTCENQSSEDQKNLVQNPSLNYLLQKRKAVQQSNQNDLSVSKSTHITPTRSPQKLNNQTYQKQQNLAIQNTEKSSNRFIYSPTKRPQKSNHSLQLQICDYSSISKIYQMDKEDKISLILQNKLLNSNAQTFEKLKSLNAIIKKKEV
ncbi:hypothetical protein ABPG72_019170 [Tetrahymena utriculariae]